MPSGFLGRRSAKFGGTSLCMHVVSYLVPMHYGMHSARCREGAAGDWQAQ